MTIEFTEDLFNDFFFEVYKCKKRFLNLVGGGGSGKSVAVVQKLMVRMLKENDHRILFVRKVARSIRDSQYQLFKDIVALYGLEHMFVFKDSALVIECPSTNSVINCKGLDDSEKLKSVAGLTLIWVEEATELSKQDFTQLNLRLRGYTKYYKQIICSYNPINEYHWIRTYPRFLDSEKALTIKTTFLDNRFLDAAYRQELLALQEQDETLWRIYGLGEWATAKGLIYTKWREAAEIPNDVEELICGLDFGFTAPTALTLVGKKGREIYIQQLLYQSHLTNNELIVKMKDMDIFKRHPSLLIYADGEDANRIEELKRAGFNVRLADKSVREGLEFCRRWDIVITSDSTEVKKEMTTYKYKHDSKTDTYSEDPVKFNDHSLDAWRYAAYTHGVKRWRDNGVALNISKRSHRREKRVRDSYANF